VEACELNPNLSEQKDIRKSRLWNGM